MKARRILVVDDFPVVLRGLCALLDGQPGWQVCGEAVDGRQAVEKARELQPDLVILDISMPELNGIAATPRILKAAPNTRVLILTMHSSEEMVERVLATGAQGYVVKSDAERDLVAAVESLLRGKPFFSPSISESFRNGDFKRKGTSPKGQAARPSLSQRECEVMQLLAEGKTNKEVAGRLGISVRTVESHRAHIMNKLRFRSLSDLVRYAVRNQVVQG